MSVSSTPNVIEQAQRRLREVLYELRLAAQQAADVHQYYRHWSSKLAELTSAVRCQCLLLTPNGSWELVQSLGAEAADEQASQSRLATALQELQRTRISSIEVDPVSTVINYPLTALGELRGAVRITLDITTDAARQTCLKLLYEAAESIERFHLLDDRRQAIQRAASGDDERRLSAAVHAGLDLTATAFALANEGRLLVGCDRLSVLVRRGRTYRVLAVSGLDEVNARAATVHALEELTRRCAATGETLTFPSDAGELDAELTQQLESYVDESHVKRLVIVPLVAPPGETSEAAKRPIRSEPLAALVVEYFAKTAPSPEEAAHLQLLTRVGTSALRNAGEHQALFLLPLWRTLGRWRQACFEPGTRRRTAMILCAVAAALAALVLVPAEFTAYCRGTLNPVERRRIFAPLDGTVERIMVKHGERIARGQPLLELRNTDLDIAEAEVEGRRIAAAEQLTAVERTLLDEAKRLTAEERARLSGERSQLREQLAAFERLLALHAEKRKQLIVVSPLDGEVTTWNADDLLRNRPVRQGQHLLTVARVDGPWELELRVPDDRSGRVVEAAQASPDPLRVTFSPAISPGTVYEGRVVEIQNSAELRGEDGNTVLVRASIQADELPQRRPGAESVAHIHCGRRSVGYVWLCDLYGFVRSRVFFRWF